MRPPDRGRNVILWLGLKPKNADIAHFKTRELSVQYRAGNIRPVELETARGVLFVLDPEKKG